MNEFHDDSIFDLVWLDKMYSGAPDECGDCFREGNIVKSSECKKHKDGA